MRKWLLGAVATLALVVGTAHANTADAYYCTDGTSLWFNNGTASTLWSSLTHIGTLDSSTVGLVWRAADNTLYRVGTSSHLYKVSQSTALNTADLGELTVGGSGITSGHGWTIHGLSYDGTYFYTVINKSSSFTLGRFATTGGAVTEMGTINDCSFAGDPFAVCSKTVNGSIYMVDIFGNTGTVATSNAAWTTINSSFTGHSAPEGMGVKPSSSVVHITVPNGASTSAVYTVSSTGTYTSVATAFPQQVNSLTFQY